MSNARILSKSVNAPMFSAIAAGGQSFPANTSTKVIFGTKEFDPTTAYNASTGRFQPNVAGYYQVNAASQVLGTTSYYISLYKNGSLAKTGSFPGVSTAVYSVSTLSALVYLNGSTDYIEVFGLSTAALNNGTNDFFQAYLVRAA